MSFVVVEGCDGVGKSRLVRGLAETIAARGAPPLVLREPGATPLGERVRALLLDPATGALDPWTEACLFTACRAEMAKNVIRPALADGRAVLLDRYFFSTLAYQGGGGGLDGDALLGLSLAATRDLMPDRVLLLDVAPEVAALRRRRRVEDRMERNDAAYHARVRAAYLDMAARGPLASRFRTLDASGDADDVLRRALEALADLPDLAPRGVGR